MRYARTGLTCLLSIAAVCFVAGCPDRTRTRSDLSEGDRTVEKATEAYQAGQYAKAADLYAKAADLGLKKYKRADVLTLQSNALLFLDKNDAAFEAADQALKADPNHVQAWVNKGIVFRQRGNYAEAERAYLQAEKIDPGDAEMLCSLGALYVLTDRPRKAVETLEKAARVAPSVPTCYSNLALAYAMVGRFDDAERSLKRAVVHGYRNAAAMRQRIDNLRATAPLTQPVTRPYDPPADED